MNAGRSADGVPESVAAYCEAIVVPDFDEAAIERLRHMRAPQIPGSRVRLRWAALAAAMVALLVVLFNIPAVVAGVQRIFQAFTVAGGQKTAMTIRVVDLKTARADMPFAVIAPPSIAGTPLVTINEMYAEGSRSDASVIFEIHGTAPGPEIMIIESRAAGHHSPTLLAAGADADTTALPRLPSPDSFGASSRHTPKLLVRGSFGGGTFVPASWVVHGTRVVVMSPPGVLSTAQLEAIRRAMTR